MDFNIKFLVNHLGARSINSMECLFTHKCYILCLTITVDSSPFYWSIGNETIISQLTLIEGQPGSIKTDTFKSETLCGVTKGGE